jgi:hypothetical protein
LGNPGDRAWVSSHLPSTALHNVSSFVKFFEKATSAQPPLTPWNPGKHMHSWPMVAQLLDRSQTRIGVKQVREKGKGEEEEEEEIRGVGWR